MATDMSKQDFSARLDQAGLTLTEAQKSELFGVYPLIQAMIARVHAPLPRDAEPSVIFMPEMNG